MARAAASDPLHAFRFHVKALDNIGLGGASGDHLQPGGTGASFMVGTGTEAGFQSVTTPEYTLETADYREGIKTYTEKYPGIPSTNDCTFSRGAARKDAAFYNWIVAAIEGAEYRSDVAIFHFRRGARKIPFDPATDIGPTRSKNYILRECIPSRVKVAADLDASTSDVSLAEVDVVFERFDVVLDTGDAATGLKSIADVGRAVGS